MIISRRPDAISGCVFQLAWRFRTRAEGI